jgi:hypothetical protein
MNNIELHSFNNFGYLLYKFTEEQLHPIKKEISEIQNNFEKHNGQAHNNNLAGNIKKEFKLLKSIDQLELITKPLLSVYDEQYSYLITHGSLTKNTRIKLVAPWVNFQQKHEFNPNHNHKGFMSFVIWIKIPYTIENEKTNSPGNMSNSNFPGHFEFSYTDILGQICNHQLPVDKEWEGICCMFPSKLVHCVYPFFTSDEYRITVSGNYYFEV